MFIDTHIDTLWALGKEDRYFHIESDIGHVDLPRAQEADLLCGFFTGYPTDSHFVTERMIRNWLIFTGAPRNKFRRIKSYHDLEKLELERQSQQAIDREIGAVLCLEGAAGIDTELNRLYIYYEIGLRSIGLTWNEMNQFATGQAQTVDRGLTQEGRDLVSAMNDLGIIVDVSHLNDKSFWGVIDATNMPIIASHSSVREICDHKRNLTKDMIQAIADSGGSIGINLAIGFLNKDREKASFNDALSMFNAVISQVGIDHVHMGADMDGATLPNEIKDIRDVARLFPKLQQEFQISDIDLVKIERDNIKRVMKNIWK